MHNEHLFEYAVIRIVPRVEREEFLNTGIILFCKSLDFLGTRYELNEKKLCCFGDDLPLGEIKANLAVFEKIAKAATDAGPIARLDTPSRFRWLTATRSTMLQTSKVHPGLCTEPQALLDKLFDELVK